MYGPLCPVTGIALLLYVDYVRTSQGTPTGLHGLLQGWLYVSGI
jgi:hypothetical protein